MSAPIIEITYVPRANTFAVGHPAEWRTFPGHGVDKVVVTGVSGMTCTLEGQSLYWLFASANGWILGGVVIQGAHASASWFLHPDGQISPVAVSGGVPDLEHDQVKLGWWDTEERKSRG